MQLWDFVVRMQQSQGFSSATKLKLEDPAIAFWAGLLFDNVLRRKLPTLGFFVNEKSPKLKTAFSEKQELLPFIIFFIFNEFVGFIKSYTSSSYFHFDSSQI